VETDLQRRDNEDRAAYQARIMLACTRIEKALKSRSSEARDQPERVFIDSYSRPPYKRYQDSQTPLNRILIRTGPGRPQDMADLSPIIASAEPFNICRAYVFRDDTQAAEAVENEMRTEIERSRHADA
jgi:hypothetical protein